MHERDTAKRYYEARVDFLNGLLMIDEVDINQVMSDLIATGLVSILR